MIPSFPLLGRTFTIYPLMALVGMFVSGIYACRSAKRAGQNEDDMIVLLLVSSLGVFLGMHLLYGLVGISQWPQLLAQIHSPASFFQVMATIWGGSVFYGGLLGGILAGAVYLRRKGRPLDLWASLTAPAIPLFHVFGRVGCFLGGCCYGLPSAWGFVYRYSPVAEANGVSRFPVQLVEAAWNLVLFLLLARLQRRAGTGCCLCIWPYTPLPGSCWNFSAGMPTGAFSWGCPPPSGSACSSSPLLCTPCFAPGINKDFTPAPFPPWGFVVY